MKQKSYLFVGIQPVSPIMLVPCTLLQVAHYFTDEQTSRDQIISDETILVVVTFWRGMHL